MKIVHSFYVMKDIFQEIAGKIKEHGPAFLKNVSHRVIDFVDQKPQYAGMIDPVKRQLSQQEIRFNNYSGLTPPTVGGRLATDHFHTPHGLSPVVGQPAETHFEESNSEVSTEQEITGKNFC